MKSIKKCLIFLIIFTTLIISTNSYAFFLNIYSNDRTDLKASEIAGISKIYKDGEVFYYKKKASGAYGEKVEEEEVQIIRNNIKNTIDSLQQRTIFSK